LGVGLRIDLRGLDAGQGQQVPTLEEVLDLVEGRVAVNIEIKSAGGDLKVSPK